MNLKYRGAKWELELFGRCSRQYRLAHYLDWNHAIREVIRYQDQLDWDPQNPPTRPALKLYNGIKSLLRKEDADLLCLYCTIGTALDFYHKTDALLVINSYVICLDATLKRDKEVQSITITPVDLYTESGFKSLVGGIASAFNTRQS